MEKIREQAESLMKKLTLDEKIGMIHGAQLFQTKGVERLGIPPLVMSDGPMGVRQEFEPDNWQTINHSDDYVTYLPCNSALAATWNRALAYTMGSVLGEEARGRGKDVILAPGINIKRSPLCGRNFEYFSEDPYLTKELAVPYIQGVQRWDVAACVKHFAVNNQETERLWVDVQIDETALREIYLPAFYDAVTRGGAHSIMGAYNLLYGEHCCQSQFLLGKILREEWGYEGTVISDWGGVHDTKAAALSELDLEMSVTYDFEQYCMANPLKEQIEKGEIPEICVDKKVVHILMLMMKLHMLDGERKTGAYNTSAHREVALTIARESLVLLKNKQGRLPLEKQKIKKLLVIGENAECIHSNGGGSSEIKALYEISPLMGLKSKLGGNVEVTFARGYCRDKKEETTDTNWQETSLKEGKGSSKVQAGETVRIQEKRKKLREEAVDLAKTYDHVILVGGLNHEQDSEGNDRTDMKLPYEQDQLILEVLKANPKTVVVMLAGSPVEMGQWIEQTDTLLWAWYGGMEGGNAIAEVLLGEINPSGKLPETFYKTHLDCSAHALGEFPGGKTVNYREGVYVGYRYHTAYGVEPEFYFGHGLSYTDFVYENLQVQKGKDGVIVSCSVRNTGTRGGAEVVQVYTNGNKDIYNRKILELKGFEKIYLEVGACKTVNIQLDQLTSVKNVGFYVGSSLTDIRLVK